MVRCTSFPFLHSLLFLLCGLTLVLCVLCPPAFAKPIYSWEDKDGTKHYSSKAPNSSAKPIKLPPITRAEVKLSEIEIVSCTSHGGIDCQAGPDKDGSVTCYDGFIGAAARYRFSCASPKLTITEISEVGDTGNFTVYVRNSKAVTASKPAVFYKPRGARKIKLAGPAEIEAFGLAEFQFEAKDSDIPEGRVDLALLDLTCGNCP